MRRVDDLLGHARALPAEACVGGALRLVHLVRQRVPAHCEPHCHVRVLGPAVPRPLVDHEAAVEIQVLAVVRHREERPVAGRRHPDVALPARTEMIDRHARRGRAAAPEPIDPRLLALEERRAAERLVGEVLGEETGPDVTEHPVRTGGRHELRIGGEAVTVEPELEEPVGAAGEVVVAPATELAGATDPQVVVVAAQAALRGVDDVDRVPALRPEDVVPDVEVVGAALEAQRVAHGLVHRVERDAHATRGVTGGHDDARLDVVVHQVVVDPHGVEVAAAAGDDADLVRVYLVAVDLG